jgi:hypothetical protein
MGPVDAHGTTKYPLQSPKQGRKVVALRSRTTSLKKSSVRNFLVSIKKKWKETGVYSYPYGVSVFPFFLYYILYIYMLVRNGGFFPRFRISKILFSNPFFFHKRKERKETRV